MKPQDIGFLILFFLLLFLGRPVWFVWVGLGCLVLAIGLFATWTFFKAERLTWYAALYFFTYILISLLRPHKVE